MKICVLASGSSGNCTYVSTEDTSILIDAGLSGKETQKRLATIEVELDAVKGICVTHEHSDHTKGLGILQRRFDVPVYANSGTVQGYQMGKKVDEKLAWTVFTTGTPFQIGDIGLESFSVPHDAYEPVGYVITAGDVRVGLVTDMGMATHLIKDKLRNCDAIIVESNHDEHLLKQSQRPWSLKNRISGRQGHLSNRHAADMVAEIGDLRIKKVFLAHLSSDCNYHDLAMQEMQRSLRIAGHHHIDVTMTFADRVSDVWVSSESDVQRQHPG